MDSTERFLGLYKAEQWFSKEAPDEPIGDDFEPFSEDHVIGADASIIEFVMTADERPTRLVVSGARVTGLVSLSDLQRLPVLAAIFTLITSLEIAMAKRIEVEWHDDAAGWLELLSDGRRAKLLDEMKTAKEKDGFVSAMVFTQISVDENFVDAQAATEYAKRHDLGDVPADMTGFNVFYKARRDRLLGKLRLLLGADGHELPAQ